MNEIVEKKRSSKPLYILLITLVILLLFSLVFTRQLPLVKEFIQQCGWFGLVISIVFYGILGASPIPSEPFTVLVASLYGPLEATLVATLGNLLAAMVEFYVGVKLGDVADFETRKKQLPLGLGKLPADSPLFLIFARMLPGYGPKCVSMISGMYKVPLWRYIWTTFVSTLVGAAIVAFGGYKLLSLTLPH